MSLKQPQSNAEKYYVHKILKAINETSDTVLNATLEDLARVYHTGNGCPFNRKVFSKMLKSEDINIEILGGSATFGADLGNKEKERWSYQLSQILESGGYVGKINVVNRAIPACNVDAWIYQTSRFKLADLVIVDLSVNDQDFDLASLPHYYASLIQLLDSLSNRPAIMFVQEFRISAKLAEVIKKCPTSFSKCCDDTVYFCPNWWEMQDFVTKALKQYNVPYVSYRDLVWPNYVSPPEGLYKRWEGESHPSKNVHTLLAKLIAYGFARQVMHAIKLSSQSQSSTVQLSREKCSEHPQTPGYGYISAEKADKSVVSICPTPLTNMFANSTAESVAHFAGASFAPDTWRFYNDSGQKYGWILNTTSKELSDLCAVLTPPTGCDAFTKRTIASIPMTFGNNPILQICFLRSYGPEMGTVVLWVDDDPAQYVTLNSYWKHEYSVRHYTTISLNKLDKVSSYVLGDHALLSTLRPGKQQLVHIAASSQVAATFKWKLIGALSC